MGCCAGVFSTLNETTRENYWSEVRLVQALFMEGLFRAYPSDPRTLDAQTWFSLSHVSLIASARMSTTNHPCRWCWYHVFCFLELSCLLWSLEFCGECAWHSDLTTTVMSSWGAHTRTISFLRMSGKRHGHTTGAHTVGQPFAP